MDSSLRRCLRRLADGEALSAEEINVCLHEIIGQRVSPAQVGAFLVALQHQKVSAEVLSASADAMLSFAIPCPALEQAGVLDIVGTGGDTWDTFNVSTAASILCAAAGAKVVKHGNRSSSGRCGSADFLEALGATITLDATQVSSVFNECGYCFLFAQTFHPAMKSVASIRKEIGVRTIFNSLGPLTNPAKPSYMLVGVGHENLGELYSHVLSRRESVKNAMVVHSLDGMDEITTSAPTTIWHVKGTAVDKHILHPEDLGLARHEVEKLLGSSPENNAKDFFDILKGEGKSALRDFLLINAGVALFVAGAAASMKDGVAKARECIDSGSAKSFLDKYIRLSNSLQQV